MSIPEFGELPTFVRLAPVCAGFPAGARLPCDGRYHGVLCRPVARDHQPVTFIVSLFNDGLAIYELDNHGGWYDLGFLVGVGGSWGSAGASTG